MQRRLAILVLGVNIGSKGNQKVNDVVGVAVAGPVQRRAALEVSDVDVLADVFEA